MKLFTVELKHWILFCNMYASIPDKFNKKKQNIISNVRLGLGCLTPLSTIFQLYRGGVLLVEEARVPVENHRPVADQLYHIMLYQVHLALSGIRTHNFSGDRH